MITVKDFAKQQGCGESIVYRHIRQHREELGDMVQKLNRKTWLTDEGQEFIRGLMIQQPLTVIESSEVEKELRRKLEDKQNKIELLQGFLLDAKDEIKALTDEKYALQSEKHKIALLEAENENKDKLLQEAQEASQKANTELEQLKKQIEEMKNASPLKRLRGWK